MTPETFESLIIEQIQAIGLIAIAYPDNPKDYFPAADPGEVLVRYEGRKPTNADLTGALNEVVYYAEIVVATRQIRGEGGAYDWLQKIHSHLQGFKLEGITGALQMGVESFMDENNGLWQFGQKWTVSNMEMQTVNDSNCDNLFGNP